MRVTDPIAQDHRRVGEMFLELERMDAGDGDRRRELLDRIVDELDVHARAEEEVGGDALERLGAAMQERKEALTRARTRAA